MLVLTRSKGQRIVIDHDVIIEIVDVRGPKVRVGITAPPDVRVDREEVDRKRRLAVDDVE